MFTLVTVVEKTVNHLVVTGKAVPFLKVNYRAVLVHCVNRDREGGHVFLLYTLIQIVPIIISLYHVLYSLI